MHVFSVFLGNFNFHEEAYHHSCKDIIVIDMLTNKQQVYEWSEKYVLLPVDAEILNVGGFGDRSTPLTLTG